MDAVLTLAASQGQPGLLQQAVLVRVVAGALQSHSRQPGNPQLHALHCLSLGWAAMARWTAAQVGGCAVAWLQGESPRMCWHFEDDRWLRP